MKIVYCADCGTRLNIMRRALPKYAKIIDVVEYHECPKEPIELDLTPADVPTFNETEDKNKFVKKLNDLSPPTALGALSTDGLQDRRKEEHVKSDIKSTAPFALIDQMKQTSPSIPEGDISKEPGDEDGT